MSLSISIVIKFKNHQNLLSYVFVPSKKTFLVSCFLHLKCITKVEMVNISCLLSRLWSYHNLNYYCLTAFEFTGLGRGGQQIQRAKEVYTKAVETLVELASLQVKFTTIAWFEKKPSSHITHRLPLSFWMKLSRLLIVVLMLLNMSSFLVMKIPLNISFLNWMNKTEKNSSGKRTI